ncbi:hypothetical protein B296_00010214 [Ensete ventricosum]|uniref:Uncharacterized protein n=1 Tax=Ensete ventricosum TaxID=4639 RepID=A0A427AHR9_ENSVE|nr:hypothetical protein B296_00010214 [Ensete ventricosum]
MEAGDAAEAGLQDQQQDRTPDSLFVDSSNSDGGNLQVVHGAMENAVVEMEDAAKTEAMRDGTAARLADAAVVELQYFVPALGRGAADGAESAPIPQLLSSRKWASARAAETREIVKGLPRGLAAGETAEDAIDAATAVG